MKKAPPLRLGKNFYRNNGNGKYFSVGGLYFLENVDYFSTKISRDIVPQNFGPALRIRQKRKKIGENQSAGKIGRFFTDFRNSAGQFVKDEQLTMRRKYNKKDRRHLICVKTDQKRRWLRINGDPQPYSLFP
jgi:hypothetical protein